MKHDESAGPKLVKLDETLPGLKSMKLDENSPAQNETWWKLPGLELTNVDEHCRAKTDETWWNVTRPKIDET